MYFALSKAFESGGILNPTLSSIGGNGRAFLLDASSNITYKDKKMEKEFFKNIHLWKVVAQNFASFPFL